MCKRERIIKEKKKDKKERVAEAKLSFKIPYASPHVKEGAL